MIKLITPPGLLLTVALLAIYSVYAFSIGSVEKSWILTLAGVVSVVGCIGTALMKRWSRFFVYALTGGFIAKVASSIHSAAASGYFGFQFDSVAAAARSLVPSLLMVLISGLCSWLVFRHFKIAGADTRGIPATQAPSPQRPGAFVHQQIPNELLWIAFLITAMLAGQWLQARVHLNHDVAWIGHSARWLLHGREFGTGIVDVNPPLIWLLSLPGAVIADAGLSSEPSAIRFAFWIYLLISTLITGRLLLRTTTAAGKGWLASLILVAALAAGASFGQREYLSLLFAMPYLASIAIRLDGNIRLRAFEAVAIGALAGIGFSIKPYFLAVPLLMEGLLAARLGIRAIWRVETAALGTMVALYAASILVFAPEYLQVTLPQARSFYWAYDSSNLDAVLTRFARASQPVVYGVLIAVLTRSWSSHHSVLLLAGLGYSVSYFIQSKGFVYHAYPVLAFACVFLGAALASGLHNLSKQSSGFKPVIRALGSGLLVAVALAPVKSIHDDVASWYFRYNIKWGPTGTFREAVIQTVERYAPARGSYFFALSTHPFPAFPTGSYTKAEWAGRAPAQGVIAAIARLDEVEDPDLRERIIETASSERQAVIDDITKASPAVVFVDAARARLGMNGRAFDDIAFYSEDPRFREIWSRYREVAPLGHLRVFVRGPD